MKVLDLDETRKIKAGRGHYHWKCSVNGFVSKVYNSWTSAARGAEKHSNNYYSHATKTTVYYCEKSCK